VTYLELAEHRINSEHKPSVDVKLRSATVKKIELLAQLGFKLDGFVLKRFRTARSERCGQDPAKPRARSNNGSLQIAEKKLDRSNCRRPSQFKLASASSQRHWRSSASSCNRHAGDERCRFKVASFPAMQEKINYVLTFRATRRIVPRC